MDKIRSFEKEYTYIQNERLRNSAKILVQELPDYFFEIAASSTGKYHPKYTLGDGGLVRHTKAAVRIAYELYQTESVTGSFSHLQKDLMIIAIILHDGIKCGFEKEQYTRFDHPLLAGEFLEKNKEKTELNEKEIEFIKQGIATHMGPWIKDYNGNEILEKPNNRFQRFIHMCDFLASRKSILFEFENNDIVD